MSKFQPWAPLALAFACAAPAWAWQAPSLQEQQAAARAGFDALDADGDGALSAREFMGPRWGAWSRWSIDNRLGQERCASAEEESRLGAIDPLPAAELCAMLGAFPLSWEGFASPSWEFFHAADANRDGSLSWAEYSAWGEGPKRAPPRPRPDAAQAARIQADLAKSNALVKSVGAQGAAELARAKPGEGAQEVEDRSRFEEVAERVRGWLR